MLDAEEWIDETMNDEIGTSAVPMAIDEFKIS
jgi:hypothetical protein